MSTHGTFYWNELMTNDVEAAKSFYEKTTGWQYDAMPMPDGTAYWLAKAGGQPVGGIMDMAGVSPPGVPPHWFTYIAVDDVDATVKSSTAAGGQVLKEPFDILGVGRIAIVSDSTGAALGFMTPASS